MTDTEIRLGLSQTVFHRTHKLDRTVWDPGAIGRTVS